MSNYNPLNPVWIDYVHIIVPIGQRNAANTREATHGNYFASDNDGIAWDRGIELSAAGAPIPPATHLWLGKLIRQPEKDDLVANGVDIPGASYYLESDGWERDAVLFDAGLEIIPDAE